MIYIKKKSTAEDEAKTDVINDYNGYLKNLDETIQMKKREWLNTADCSKKWVTRKFHTSGDAILKEIFILEQEYENIQYYLGDITRDIDHIRKDDIIELEDIKAIEYWAKSILQGAPEKVINFSTLWKGAVGSTYNRHLFELLEHVGTFTPKMASILRKFKFTVSDVVRRA
jgi:hypothetical protein